MWPFHKRYSLITSGFFDQFADYHSHILPSVDDGVPTMDESLEILSFYEELGIKEVWQTPHIMEDIPNTTQNLQEKFNELKKNYHGKIELCLAAEYMLDSLFKERFSENDLLPLGKEKNHLLVETSYFNPPMKFYDILEQIKSKGFFPVLAHPERYVYMIDKDYRKLKEMRIKFQLNLPSLAGMYGDQVRKKANNILNAGMYDFYGTDIHDLKSFSQRASIKNLGKEIYKQLVLNSYKT